MDGRYATLMSAGETKQGWLRLKDQRDPQCTYLENTHLCGPHHEGMNLWAKQMLWEAGKHHNMTAGTEIQHRQQNP